MRQKLKFGETVRCPGDACPQTNLPPRRNALGAALITNHLPALRATDCLLRPDDLRREGSPITAFLIDTPAIRITLNSMRINARIASNRHSSGPLLPLKFLRNGKPNGD